SATSRDVSSWSSTHKIFFFDSAMRFLPLHIHAIRRRHPEVHCPGKKNKGFPSRKFQPFRNSSGSPQLIALTREKLFEPASNVFVVLDTKNTGRVDNSKNGNARPGRDLSKAIPLRICVLPLANECGVTGNTISTAFFTCVNKVINHGEYARSRG